MFLNLIKEIKSHNLTYKQVAEKLNLNINSLHHKIYGKIDFKLTEVEQILSMFPGTSMDYLFKKENQNK